MTELNIFFTIRGSHSVWSQTNSFEVGTHFLVIIIQKSLARQPKKSHTWAKPKLSLRLEQTLLPMLKIPRFDPSLLTNCKTDTSEELSSSAE